MPTRRHDMISFKNGKEKQTELLGRIRRLEGLVEGLSTQLETSTSQLDPAITDDLTFSDGFSNVSGPLRSSMRTASVDSDSPPSGSRKEFGRLFKKQDGTMYIGNRFWAVLWDEVRIETVFRSSHLLQMMLTTEHS